MSRNIDGYWSSEDEGEVRSGRSMCLMARQSIECDEGYLSLGSEEDDDDADLNISYMAKNDPPRRNIIQQKDFLHDLKLARNAGYMTYDNNINSQIRGYGVLINRNFSVSNVAFTWVFFPRIKSATTTEISNFIKGIEVLVKLHVRRLQSDNGSEFTNVTIEKFLFDKGIDHNFSTYYTYQQNGVVERRNRTLVEAPQTMLKFANLPLYLWVEVVSTTNFTQNESIINRHLNMTPYEAING
ncbi:uncharacterized protein LOC111889371 [Lactuca sativa]|uniref:uncharacterized protein LOC111889371 n=1 Tax=Lactuca sativa TaxID=4236 RepID=UPI000CD8219B|nr:uncharacterized protein LOC111889371 [Lactuca sativa]